MRRPRIGIPLCLDDRGRWRPGHSYSYFDRSYADAVARAGGAAIALPIQDDPENLIAEIDGLLLPGGDDLPPDDTEDPHAVAIFAEKLDLTPIAQLDFDRALLRASIHAKRPILGICYGMQLLAREGGGRLDAHLPSQRPEAKNHKLSSEGDRHPLHIEAKSRLALDLGCTEIEVNSLHHQAVREVGSRHRVVARSPDGVIEAIEARTGGAPFELGVQWHPEKLDAAPSRRLFESFVDACRSHETQR